MLASADEEHDAKDTAALEALAASCGIEYARGAAESSPGGLPGYLITRVGPFMQEYERLSARHLAAGSEQAALITCEKNQACFGAWGRPFAFHSQTLRQLDRPEECRDLARHALTMPLWTLGAELSELCALAETSIEELAGTTRLRASGELTPEQLRSQNGMEKRTPQQIAKDRASYLLDLVVAQPDEYSWEGCREQLAAHYTEAGMAGLAAFVRA